MRKIVAAAVQMKMCDNAEHNREKAYCLAKEAAKNGANIILLPELFETPYFCQSKNYDYYSLADKLTESKAVKMMQELSKKYNVVIPVSFYEKSGNTYFNSAAVIDAGGDILGVYRKNHIPDDHFYQEKFYFSPGDTGFKVWNTRYGKIGIGICWDQWFPEAARCMAIEGAEILLYPTAIGSEPILDVDSKAHWQRCMQGHAAANICPVIAANRTGTEFVNPCAENQNQSSSLVFYGSSFITDCTGDIIKEMDRESEGIIAAESDLDEINKMRTDWGVFRDRRPETYKKIMCLS